jgi:hypothetical protein
MSVTPRPGKFNFMSIRQMRRHRVWLVDRGLLFYERRNNVGLYLLNISGMGRELCKAYKAHGWLDNSTIASGIQIFEKAEQDFERNFYPTDVGALMEGVFMAEIEEMLKRGEKQNVDGKKMRHMRQDAKELSVSLFVSYMKRLCEEYEVEFFDPGALDNQKRFLRSIKTFLGYWKKRSEDPREFLDKVVRHWSEFRTKQLKNVNGFPITLNTTVSFTQFYKYRAEIETWIKFAEKRQESELKVVVLHRSDAQVAEELEQLEKLIPDS